MQTMENISHGCELNWEKGQNQDGKKQHRNGLFFGNMNSGYDSSPAWGIEQEFDVGPSTSSFNGGVNTSLHRYTYLAG